MILINYFIYIGGNLLNLGITAVNLSTMPFISSCDCTRTNMAAKQYAQSLTHLNCEIPYVLSQDWEDLSHSSELGIQYAEDDGEVIYNEHDLLISHFPKQNKIETNYIPPIKNCYSIFGSSLRNSLKAGTKFKKNDIIWEYDAFTDGIPTNGYNVMTCYAPFFGFNHEDALVISESLAEKGRHKFVENIFIPIYEYSLFQKIFDNELKYFPDLGTKLDTNVICASLLPPNGKKEFDSNSIKTQVLNTLQNLNLSDLINMRITGHSSGFTCEKVKTKIVQGEVTGFKIHRLKKDINLIDQDLQSSIEKLRKNYNFYILDLYNDLKKLVNASFGTKVLRQYYLYGDRDKIRKDLMLGDAVYLLEFEISCDHGIHVGDKMSKMCTHEKYN